MTDSTAVPSSSVPEGQTAPSREPSERGKLLPCPFCGSGDLEHYQATHGVWHVSCQQCGAEVPGDSALAVASLWNDRPRTPDSVVPPSERQALSEELERRAKVIRETITDPLHRMAAHSAWMDRTDLGLIANTCERAAALLRSPIAFDQKAVAEWLWRHDGGHLNNPAFTDASSSLQQEYLNHARDLLAVVRKGEETGSRGDVYAPPEGGTIPDRPDAFNTRMEP